MKIKDILNFLEAWAPLSLQESYDNAGLILGDKNDEVSKALITLDVTEEVVKEAIEEGAEMIIAHHPIVFKPLKKIGKSKWIDRCLRKCIQHDIAIYATHTNLDNVVTGVNHKIGNKLGLQNLSILSPKSDTLLKLTVFVPQESKDKLLKALFNAGAGKIGNYDQCSFQQEGIGTFRPNKDANPTIGTADLTEQVKESRIEVMLPSHNQSNVLAAMKVAHPYEEVAYYLYRLENHNQEVGSGMIGELNEAMSVKAFLDFLKDRMNLQMIRHTRFDGSIKKVALCGGSGSFLLGKALSSKADAFVTADFKYHEFFDADAKIMIADIGHYESEVYTKDLLYDRLTEKFPKFAFRLSKVDTNPIKYF